MSTQEPVCEYYEPTPRRLCDENHGKLMCSRPAGHDGPHVACAPPDHELVEWTEPEVTEA